MARAAGSSTAATASASSGRTARRRSTVGSPVATTPRNTSVDTAANSVARELGTASLFQIPPRPARLPSVPSPGSARGANATTPAADSGAANDGPVAAATSHGSAASNAAPSTAAAHSHRDRPAPGPTAQARPTVAASISPVGVRPASAIQNAKANHPVDAERSPSTAVATQGRQP